MEDVKQDRCYFSKSLGRYYISHPAEKQWCVHIGLPGNRQLQALWPEAEEPDTQGSVPSDIIELIAARVEAQFISGRDRDREIIAWARANAEQLDSVWSAERIKDLQAQIKRLTGFLVAPPLKAIHVVFDDLPGPDGARLIEVETPDGFSINAGEWRKRPDGYAVLVLTPDSFAHSPA